MSSDSVPFGTGLRTACFPAPRRSKHGRGTGSSFRGYICALRLKRRGPPTPMFVHVDYTGRRERPADERRVDRGIDGVRSMTLYQAKRLQFPIVFVARLVKDEWPLASTAPVCSPKMSSGSRSPLATSTPKKERRLRTSRSRERVIGLSSPPTAAWPRRGIGRRLSTECARIQSGDFRRRPVAQQMLTTRVSADVPARAR